MKTKALDTSTFKTKEKIQVDIYIYTGVEGNKAERTGLKKKKARLL